MSRNQAFRGKIVHGSKHVREKRTTQSAVIFKLYVNANSVQEPSF